MNEIRNIKNSQNFLHSNNLVLKIIKNAKINSNDVVFDIGAGKGIITQNLNQICKKVIAIELDSSLFFELKQKFTNTNVEVIHQDFLIYHLPEYPYKVFANIPFNMTAEIINKLLADKNPAQEIYLIMQYEAFLKYAGEPFYTESFKSLIYKPFFESEIAYRFQKTDFSPIPNANIILAHFHFKENCDIDKKYIAEWRDLVSFFFLERGQNFKMKSQRLFSYAQQKKLMKSAGIINESPIGSWTYNQWLAIFSLFHSNMVSESKKGIILGSFRAMQKQSSSIEKEHRNRRVYDKNKTGKYQKNF